MAGVYRPRHPERTVLYRVLFHHFKRFLAEYESRFEKAYGKGQVMVRYYSLYANAHRGKVRKAGRNPFALRMVEEELKPVPSKGWAAMIRKVYEVDPMVCPKCGGTMKVVAFITDYAAVDRIIDHLKLKFVA